MAHRDDRNRGKRDRTEDDTRRDFGGRGDFERNRHDTGHSSDNMNRGYGRNTEQNFGYDSDLGGSYRGSNARWSNDAQRSERSGTADNWRPGGMKTSPYGEGSLSGGGFSAGDRGSREQEYLNPDYRGEGRFGETYRDENYESWGGDRGSAFSDYQTRDYGANTQHWDSARNDRERDMPSARARMDDRDWNSPAYRDEGFFGSGAETNRSWSGPHAGKGPQNYRRSDERIHEDVCERLTMHGQIDATNVEVKVDNGEVTLSGRVDSRQAKRLAEDAIEDIPGVHDINNQLRVAQAQGDREQHVTTHSDKARGGSTKK